LLKKAYLNKRILLGVQ